MMRWTKTDEQIIIYADSFWHLNSWTQYLTESKLVAREGLITTQFMSSNGESGNWGAQYACHVRSDSLHCGCEIVSLGMPE